MKTFSGLLTACSPPQCDYLRVMITCKADRCQPNFSRSWRNLVLGNYQISRLFWAIRCPFPVTGGNPGWETAPTGPGKINITELNSEFSFKGKKRRDSEIPPTANLKTYAFNICMCYNRSIRWNLQSPQK